MDIEELKSRLDAALELIRAEALRAMTKHAPMKSSHEAFGVIFEEFMIEFAEEMKANDSVKQAAEMVQVGAMAARALVDVYGVKFPLRYSPPPTPVAKKEGA